MYRKTRKIKFGNKSGYIIDEFKIKLMLINFLFDSIELEYFFPKNIETEEDLLHLNNNKHYVIPNLEGEEYFMIIKKFKDVHLCVLLNKKNIKPKKEDINYNDIKVITLKTRIKKKSYNGTIFEGKLLSNNDKLLYLITNVHKLQGEDKSNLTIIEKYNLLDKYIEENIFMDEKMNNLYIKVSPLYEYDKLKFLVEEKIKKSNFIINGLIFIPKKNGLRYIFKEYNDEKSEKITENDLLLNNGKEIFANLVLNKLQTDVYNVYCLDKNTKKRIGIAHIPTIECSHYCNDIFEKNQNDLTIKCKFDVRFNKWIPLIKINSKTKPNNFKDICKAIATCVTDL
jgi:hypothetical protein